MKPISGWTPDVEATAAPAFAARSLSRAGVLTAATAGMANVDITIYPGVQHGYTAAVNPKAYDPDAARNSLARAVAVIDGLRDTATLAAAS